MRLNCPKVVFWENVKYLVSIQIFKRRYRNLKGNTRLFPDEIPNQKVMLYALWYDNIYTTIINNTSVVT